MNELQSFISEKFGEIRSTVINGEPWLVAKDVAIALGYKKPRNAVARHVDEEDKDALVQGTPGGEQTMTIINESGLYALIFGSKLEKAKEFKHWVTYEVLPQIRQTGGYGRSMFRPDGTVDTAVAREMLDELDAMRERNNKLLLENTLKEQKIAEYEPKVSYYDIVLNTPDLMYTSAIAKNYGMSARAFNKMLHEFKIIYPVRGTAKLWVPYQSYSRQGYAKVVQEVNSGCTYQILKWTQKGQLFLYEFLKEKGILPLIEQEDDDDI